MTFSGLAPSFQSQFSQTTIHIFLSTQKRSLPRKQYKAQVLKHVKDNIIHYHYLLLVLNFSRRLGKTKQVIRKLWRIWNPYESSHPNHALYGKNKFTFRIQDKSKTITYKPLDSFSIQSVTLFPNKFEIKPLLQKTPILTETDLHESDDSALK